MGRVVEYIRGAKSGPAWDHEEVAFVRECAESQKDRIELQDFSRVASLAVINPLVRPQLERCYNKFIAPYARTKAVAFNLWATHLAYTHPFGTTLNLNLDESERGDYGETYYGYRRHVNENGGVAFLFLPVKRDPQDHPCHGKDFDIDKRAIILFRGTCDQPAFYPKDTHWPHELEFSERDATKYAQEPTGWNTDYDFIGVGRKSFGSFQNQLLHWVSNEASYRNITFVGHSLGGAEALRGQDAYHGFWPHQSRSCHVYAYAPPGLELTSRWRLGELDPSSRKVVLHIRDLVTWVGYLPPSELTVVQDLDKKAEETPFKVLHVTPFLAAESIWNLPLKKKQIWESPYFFTGGDIIRRFYSLTFAWFYRR